MIIASPDLFHSIDAVGSRHLDIRGRNVRAEALCRFNHTSAGLGIRTSQVSLNSFSMMNFRGIDHDSFVIPGMILYIRLFPLFYRKIQDYFRSLIFPVT